MVIAVKDVERWVQPDLASGSTVGDAVPRVSAISDCAVAINGLGRLVLSARSPAAAAVRGNAPIVLLMENYPRPRSLANAIIAITTDFSTDDYLASTLSARITILTRAITAVAGFADAVFGVLVRPTGIKVAVEGVAELAFGDFGMDQPVFPFGFPYQFTDFVSEKIGNAVVSVDATGRMDGAGGFADASIRINAATPLSLKGTVTMFPFRFPGVFDSTATVRLGEAVVDFGRQWFKTAVAVDAVALVPIYGASNALKQTIFAFTFPAIFDSSGYATADAFVSMVADGSSVVVVDADAVVDISTFVSVDSSAVFPWEFGVIFQ